MIKVSGYFTRRKSLLIDSVVKYKLIADYLSFCYTPVTVESQISVDFIKIKPENRAFYNNYIKFGQILYLFKKTQLTRE